MVRMDRHAARRRTRRDQTFRADGGTAMGTLAAAWPSRSSTTVPSATQRHAILLTDGENQHETPDELTRRDRRRARALPVRLPRRRRRLGGRRGARIATALLGTVDLIPSPDEMAGRVRRADAGRDEPRRRRRGAAGLGAAGRAGAVRPPGLADRRGPDPAPRARSTRSTGAYPTGAWGDESRDYHVAVRLAAKAVGQEQLAARVQLAFGDEVVAQSLVKAIWSDDDALTTRINPEVAHYTGQTELAEAIQDGLAAKAAGDDVDRHRQARPRRAARRRDRQRGGHDPAAQGRRHRRRRTPAPCGSSAMASKARRDGPRHGLHQDHPGAQMTRSRCPNGHHVQRRRLLRRLRCADRRRGVAGRRPPAPAAPTRQPTRGVTRRRPAKPCPNCGTENAAGRAVLRELRLRLHHRRHAPTGQHAAEVPSHAQRRPAGPSRHRWRPSGSRRSGSTPTGTPQQDSDDPCPRPACRSSSRCASAAAGRPAVAQPQHPPGDRLQRRRRGQSPSGAADHRRHRWWVEDLQSSNGTYVGPASGPLPTTPIPPGQRHELDRGRPDPCRRLDPDRGAPRVGGRAHAIVRCTAASSPWRSTPPRLAAR